MSDINISKHFILYLNTSLEELEIDMKEMHIEKYCLNRRDYCLVVQSHRSIFYYRYYLLFMEVNYIS